MSPTEHHLLSRKVWTPLGNTLAFWRSLLRKRGRESLASGGERQWLQNSQRAEKDLCSKFCLPCRRCRHCGVGRIIKVRCLFLPVPPAEEVSGPITKFPIRWIPFLPRPPVTQIHCGKERTERKKVIRSWDISSSSSSSAEQNFSTRIA